MNEDRNRAARGDGQGAPLSVRERQVLGMIAAGDSGAGSPRPWCCRLRPCARTSAMRCPSWARPAARPGRRAGLPAQRDRRPGGAPAGATASPADPRIHAHHSNPHRAIARQGGPHSREVRRDPGDPACGTGVPVRRRRRVLLAEEDGLSLRRAAIQGHGDENGDHPHPERVAGQGTLGRAALERRAQLAHGSGPHGDARGRTTIYAPMIPSGRLVGVICLTTRPSRLTGRGELLLLQAFANRVGEILVSSRGDSPSRLRETLERFRASWLAAGAPSPKPSSAASTVASMARLDQCRTARGRDASARPRAARVAAAGGAFAIVAPGRRATRFPRCRGRSPATGR